MFQTNPISKTTRRIQRATRRLASLMGEPTDDYSNQGLSDEHFGAADRERLPYIRLAAAVMRTAGEDIQAARKAELSIRALAERKGEMASEEVVKKMEELLALLQEGHNTVLWINGAGAPLNFSNVTGELELSPEMARWALSRIFSLDIEVDCSAVTSPWADLFEAADVGEAQ